MTSKMAAQTNALFCKSPIPTWTMTLDWGMDWRRCGSFSAVWGTVTLGKQCVAVLKKNTLSGERLRRRDQGVRPPPAVGGKGTLSIWDRNKTGTIPGGPLYCLWTASFTISHQARDYLGYLFDFRCFCDSEDTGWLATRSFGEAAGRDFVLITAWAECWSASGVCAAPESE